jgi:hypothetical protein
MNRMLAKALGSGVEAAALTPFEKWCELLVSKETLADSFEDEKGSVAAYELLAVQKLEDLGETVIEVRVLAADGDQQLTAYFYARSSDDSSST